MLKELSELIDINAFEDANGGVSVLVANGRPLVAGTALWQLSTETNPSGLQDVVWVDDVGNRVNISNDISGGKLKGWLETRDVVITDHTESSGHPGPNINDRKSIIYIKAALI